MIRDLELPFQALEQTQWFDPIRRALLSPGCFHASSPTLTYAVRSFQGLDRLVILPTCLLRWSRLEIELNKLPHYLTPTDPKYAM